MAAQAGLALGPSQVSPGGEAQGLRMSAPCNNWSGNGSHSFLSGQSGSITGKQKNSFGQRNSKHKEGARLSLALQPRASATSASPKADVQLTCRQCKKSFDPNTNGPRACRYHPAHYGGEVKRKWKSYKYHQVGTQFLYHSEETKAGWGEVETFWDCCGQNDPAHPGCEEAPHRSYDD